MIKFAFCLAFPKKNLKDFMLNWKEHRRKKLDSEPRVTGYFCPQIGKSYVVKMCVCVFEPKRISTVREKPKNFIFRRVRVYVPPTQMHKFSDRFDDIQGAYKIF